MIATYEATAFLPDVDNTLLDNERIRGHIRGRIRGLSDIDWRTNRGG